MWRASGDVEGMQWMMWRVSGDVSGMQVMAWRATSGEVYLGEYQRRRLQQPSAYIITADTETWRACVG